MAFLSVWSVVVGKCLGGTRGNRAEASPSPPRFQWRRPGGEEARGWGGQGVWLRGQPAGGRGSRDADDRTGWAPDGGPRRCLCISSSCLVTCHRPLAAHGRVPVPCPDREGPGPAACPPAGPAHGATASVLPGSQPQGGPQPPHPALPLLLVLGSLVGTGPRGCHAAPRLPLSRPPRGSNAPRSALQGEGRLQAQDQGLVPQQQRQPRRPPEALRLRRGECGWCRADPPWAPASRALTDPGALPSLPPGQRPRPPALEVPSCPTEFCSPEPLRPPPGLRRLLVVLAQPLPPDLGLWAARTLGRCCAHTGPLSLTRSHDPVSRPRPGSVLLVPTEGVEGRAGQLTRTQASDPPVGSCGHRGQQAHCPRGLPPCQGTPPRGVNTTGLGPSRLCSRARSRSQHRSRCTRASGQMGRWRGEGAEERREGEMSE